MSIEEKKARAEHANQLIKAIASHGRKFFLSSKGDVAAFEVDAKGKVWYQDDYTRTLIPMGVACRWKGFSHGGGLRALVERMWEYIEGGKPMSSAWIGPERSFDLSNVWGYAPDEMQACRDACRDLPIIAQEEAVAA